MNPCEYMSSLSYLSPHSVHLKMLDHSSGFQQARDFAHTTSRVSAVLRWRAGSAATAADHPLSRASSGPWDMEQVRHFSQGTDRVAESSADRKTRVMMVCLEMGKALESLGEKDGKRSRYTG